MRKTKWNDLNRDSSQEETDNINHDEVVKRIHDAMDGQPEWAKIVGEKIIKQMELSKLLEDQKKVKQAKIGEIDALDGRLEELARERLGVNGQMNIVTESEKQEQGE